MATETTLTSAVAWRPDLNMHNPADAVGDALILSHSNVAGIVEGDAPSMRIAYVTDDTAGFTAEGGTISEANPALSEVLVYTSKITQLVRLSNEQYRQAGTAVQLAQSVQRAIVKKADEAFLAEPHPGSKTQTVTLTNATGGTFTLSTIDGTETATIAHNAADSAVESAVQALGGDFAAATVTGSNGGPYTITTATAAGTLTADGSSLTPATATIATKATGVDVAPSAGLIQVPGIVNGEEIGTDLDGLIDLVAQLEANGSNPSGIILSPTGWASLRKLKTASSSNESLIGAGSNDAARRLLDLPVTVSAAMPAAHGLVIDNTAVVPAVGPVRVDTDESVYFSSDGVGLRATWRIGHNIVRPDRVGTFTVAAS